MSLKEALSLKNKEVEVEGIKITLRRPSLADLAEAVNIAKSGNISLTAWLVFNHLLENNSPVFASPEEALNYDGLILEKIALEVDKLYSEGSK